MHTHGPLATEESDLQTRQPLWVSSQSLSHSADTYYMPSDSHTPCWIPDILKSEWIRRP